MCLILLDLLILIIIFVQIFWGFKNNNNLKIFHRLDNSWNKICNFSSQTSKLKVKIRKGIKNDFFYKEKTLYFKKFIIFLMLDWECRELNGQELAIQWECKCRPL